MNPATIPAHSDTERADEIGLEIARLAAHIHAANYRWLVLIREFDTLAGWAHQGCRSCAHWLNWRCGVSLHTAREKVRVAKALGELPKVSEAFEQGRVSYSKARAITRVANADNEKFLLGIALQGTASHLDQLVRLETRRVKNADLAEKTLLAHDTRAFEWTELDDGRVELRGMLPKETAARLIKALENIEDEMRGEQSGAEKDVPAGTPKPTMDQRRADALARLADEALIGKHKTATSTDGHLVVLHVPAGTSGEPARLSPGGAISIEAARRVCCDTAIVPIVEDQNGTPLNIGRKSRKISPALRRALHQRDRSCCRFPGCTNTRYLDGHHIEHWANGGETKLSNLVLLCSHHHTLVHEGGFSCRMVDGVPQFAMPDGQSLPTAWPLDVLHESPKDFEKQFAALSLTADTCLPDWYGDPPDYDLALCHLDQVAKNTHQATK